MFVHVNLNKHKNETTRVKGPGPLVLKMEFVKSIKPVRDVIGKETSVTAKEVVLVRNMESHVSEEVRVTTVDVNDGITVEEEFMGGSGLGVGETPSDIKQFLEKELIFPVVAWSTAATRSSNIYTVSPSTLMTARANYIDKLQGINMMKFKAEVCVKINAYPFQAGRLILHFLPNVANHSSGWLATRNINLTTKTQHPHVEIDSQDSCKSLIVPYVAPTNYWEIFTDQYDMGTFYLDVLSPLTVGASGSTTADITVSLIIRDVELAAPFVPNSESSTMGKEGSITAGLKVARKVVNGLSAIPVISNYAGPVQWVLDRAIGVASVFGFSKPMIDGEPTVMQANPWRYYATSDGADCSYPIGHLRNNRLAVATDVSVRNEDEMSLRWLFSQYAYVAQYSWSTGSTSVFQQYIGPSTCINAQDNTYVSGTKTCTFNSGPPFWYLSQYFQLWRGSIKVKLKIIKTQYHTGRLLIIWTPCYLQSGLSVPVDSTFSLRHLVDIRETSEVELVLPFLVPQNYLQCNTTTSIVPNCTSGLLMVQVQNQLRAPETCAQAVQVLVYYAGGDDFELGAATYGGNNTLYPMMIGNMDRGAAGSVTVSDVIGNEKVPKYSLKYAAMSLGEEITSVKSILNKAALMLYQSYTGTGLALVPFAMGATTTASGVLNSTLPPGGDMFSCLGLMYNFFRGGIRIGIVGTARSEWKLYNAQTLTLWATAYTQESPNTNYTASTTYIAAYGNLVTDATTNNLQSIIIPYYGKYRTSLVDFATSQTKTFEDSQPLGGLVVSSVSANPYIYRSAAEDFQLSYFIGCPPVFVSLM